jgi:lipoprotein-anchoring transpeptidase ErfK/SrfK
VAAELSWDPASAGFRGVRAFVGAGFQPDFVVSGFSRICRSTFMAQMRQLTCAALVGAVAFSLSASAAPQRGKAGQTHTKPAPRTEAKAPPPAPECGQYLGFQVLLDKQGFSVGQIDGKPGTNFSHALAALQSARKLPASGEPDCATWHALGGDTSGPPTVSYTITQDDVKGPFVKTIPRALPAQANLPALGYTSVLEKLGERFHTSPAMLQQLNPGVRFTADTAIVVPAVQPFDADAPKPAPDPAAADATVQVTKDESALRVTRADGTLIFFAPVTTGSEHDPLPLGDWKVTAVSWHPTFHYNPDLFWDAKATDTRATLKPGPNNPVGIVWIDVNIEHYGMHGTPEPGNIGHTESHGCVRLTNWDAARLTALVKPGTPVLFR